MRRGQTRTSILISLDPGRARMPASKWSTVERQLIDLDKPELIELLCDLFKSSDTARTFLAMREDGAPVADKPLIKSLEEVANLEVPDPYRSFCV
jgi:hypothetical protein